MIKFVGRYFGMVNCFRRNCSIVIFGDDAKINEKQLMLCMLSRTGGQFVKKGAQVANESHLRGKRNLITEGYFIQPKSQEIENQHCIVDKTLSHPCSIK